MQITEFIKIIENDGDAYFDISNIDHNYSLKNPKSRTTLTYMPTDEFLKLVPSDSSAEKLNNIKRLAKKNIKFSSLPMLSFIHDGKGNAKVVSHEGRHRALYLQSIGVQKIPVILNSTGYGEGKAIRWGEANNKNSYDYVANMPTRLYAEESNYSVPMPQSVIYPRVLTEVFDQELNSIPSNMSDEEIKEFLHNNGYEQPISRFYSDVYLNPQKNYVVKVCRVPIDIAYLKFVNYVLKNPNNINLPKISPVKWFGEGDNKFFIVLIEKLAPMSDNNFANLIHKWLNHYVEDKPLPEELEIALKPYTNLLNTLEDIDNTLVGFGTVFDLNVENFMLRGNIPVITDPLGYFK